MVDFTKFKQNICAFTHLSVCGMYLVCFKKTKFFQQLQSYSTFKTLQLTLEYLYVTSVTLLMSKIAF